MRLIWLAFLAFSFAACGAATDLSTEQFLEPEQEGSERPDEELQADSLPDESAEPSGLDDATDATASGVTGDADEVRAETNSIDGPILILGDSVMAWNVEEGTSIGHVIEERTGQSVTIGAVSGAHFASDNEDDIRSQYVDGDWSWVVFDGGGNDLNDRCECGDCSEVLNELISTDGARGAVPDAVDALRETGTRVMFLTYYDLPPTAQFGFASCGDESDALAIRAELMAQARDGVYWVDMGRVIAADDLSAFDDDHVHPSERGSALIGELIVGVMLAD